MRKLPKADLLKLRGERGFAVIERRTDEFLWWVAFRWQGVGIVEHCRNKGPTFPFRHRADARLFAEAVLERGLLDVQRVLLEDRR